MSDNEPSESGDDGAPDDGHQGDGDIEPEFAGPVSSPNDDETGGSSGDEATRTAPSSETEAAVHPDSSSESFSGSSAANDDQADESPVGTSSIGDPDDPLAAPDSTIAVDDVAIDPDEIDPTELTVPVRSLHPHVRYLWILRAAITATVIGVIVAIVDRFVIGIGPELPIAVGTGLLVIGIVHALLSYRIWRYEVREDALYLERGVLTRVRTVVPFVRIQHVDTSRSPVERLVGLSTSVVYTAGSRGADVSIPGLESDRAEDLQGRLKRLAIAAEGDDAV